MLSAERVEAVKLKREKKIGESKFVQRHLSSFGPIQMSFRHDLKMYPRLENAQTDR